MSNLITWELGDFAVDEGQEAITRLDIYRIPAHVSLDRSNLSKPLIVTFTEELYFEDVDADDNMNYRYFVVPHNAIPHSGDEWPAFTKNPGIPDNDNGTTASAVATSFSITDNRVRLNPIKFMGVDNGVTPQTTINSTSYDVNVIVSLGE